MTQIKCPTVIPFKEIHGMLDQFKTRMLYLYHLKSFIVAVNVITNTIF